MIKLDCDLGAKHRNFEQYLDERACAVVAALVRKSTHARMPLHTDTGGEMHTCALVTGGAIKCWGMNLNGQLGIGDAENQFSSLQAVNLGTGLDVWVVNACASRIKLCS